MPRRRRGRPSNAAISPDAILGAALELLEEGGLAAVTMRALARRLGVDPMALYHYFADRDALLAAAAAQVYGDLATRVSLRGTWQARLLALALAYLQVLARSGELLRYVTAHGAAAALPTKLFTARFADAIEPLALPRRRVALANDVFVDFLHGFALGVPRSGLTPALRRQLRAELAIVFAGIAACGTVPP